MDEKDARLALLQSEISAIESAVRGYDTIAYQVKGWCVTASLAIAGFALSGHRGLLALGGVAVVGFWVVDSQSRAVQRVFLNRNIALREALRRDGLTVFLNGAGSELSLGSPELSFCKRGGLRSFIFHLTSYTRRVLSEATRAHTLGLYLLLLVSLGIEAAAI